MVNFSRPKQYNFGNSIQWWSLAIFKAQFSKDTAAQIAVPIFYGIGLKKMNYKYFIGLIVYLKVHPEFLSS